jgi:PAS domain-containing protein
VAHVELSLSEALVVSAPTPVEPDPGTLRRWAAAVAAAAEPCLVIDAETRIVATSLACRELLGLADPALTAGRHLLDTLRLVDFTAAPNQLDVADADKIPPLLALTSGRLARGLMRVSLAAPPDPAATVDAITTPLVETGIVVGSLTFLSPI